MPVDLAYAEAAQEGRPLNYGFSTSWALSRMIELAGAEVGGAVRKLLRHMGDPAWQAPASAAQTASILGRLEADLAAGALGIGVVVGYAPLLDPREYLAVAELAAAAGVPTYTHARALVEFNPAVPVDGAEEIAHAAGETGAAMHYCHVNSTSNQQVDRVLTLLDQVRREGSAITTEAYPYGAGSTGPGAAFLAPNSWRTRDCARTGSCTPAPGSGSPTNAAFVSCAPPIPPRSRTCTSSTTSTTRPSGRSCSAPCCSPAPPWPATRCH